MLSYEYESKIIEMTKINLWLPGISSGATIMTAKGKMGNCWDGNALYLQCGATA